MSEPPKDDNPPMKDMISEISKGLEEAGFLEDDIKSDLLDGIQDSLRALFGDVFQTEEPQVHVVEGGRDPDAPPTEGARPNLKVADAVDFAEEESAYANEDSPNISVRVFRPNLQQMLPKEALSTGEISLADEQEEQLLYTGKSERLYRIHVRTGSAHLFADDEPCGTLYAEQSLDIEARHIKLVRNGSDVIKGTFALMDREE